MPGAVPPRCISPVVFLSCTARASHSLAVAQTFLLKFEPITVVRLQIIFPSSDFTEVLVCESESANVLVVLASVTFEAEVSVSFPVERLLPAVEQAQKKVIVLNTMNAFE